MIRGKPGAAPASRDAVGYPEIAGGRKGRRLGRIIYLLLVSGLAVFLLTSLVGNLVTLKASGITTSDKFVVGAAYTARVNWVGPQPGDSVQAGQQIGALQSVEVMNNIAGLMERIGKLDMRQMELGQRRELLEGLKPVATARVTRARENVRRMSEGRAREAATSVFQSQVMREAFEAERDERNVTGELSALQNELTMLQSAREPLQKVLTEAERSYDGGRIAAPVSGVIAANVASPGQVLRAGEPVLEILTGPRFILAYLPIGRLFDVDIGEQVIVTNGVAVFTGRVERIDAVADNLPQEFRSAFGVQDRQQIMRIQTDEPLTLPYLARVEVASYWSLTHLAAIIKGWYARL